MSGVAAGSVHTEIGDALARIVSVLAVPVLLLALAALVVCAFEAGRFATETLRRRRSGREAVRLLAEAAIQEPGRAEVLATIAPTAPTARAIAGLATASAGADPALAEDALADFELAVQRQLDRTRILVRAGPALGLMGTLIPLAPGLKALGEGNISELAVEFRIAFAATVVGILVGTVAFALTLARTRRGTEDLAELERAARGVGAPLPPAAGPGPLAPAAGTTPLPPAAGRIGGSP